MLYTRLPIAKGRYYRMVVWYGYHYANQALRAFSN